MLSLRELFVAFVFCTGAFAQDEWFAHEIETTAWPPPETLVRDLRSADENVRLNALRLAGVGENLIYDYGTTSVVKADQVMLRYAALGSSERLDAILALHAGPMSYVAVAIPEHGGWQRIGISNGFCKYCFEDPLGQGLAIVQQTMPGPAELVIHFENGGSGMYTRQSVYFRIRAGKIVPVLSFEDRHRTCPAAPMRPCEIERRWFEHGFLVETSGTIGLNPQDQLPEVFWRLPDLELRYTSNLNCTPYAWSSSHFNMRRPVHPAAVLLSADPTRI